MALLEDEDERPERSGDRGEVCDHSLQRQHHRPGEHEQHDVGDEHDSSDSHRRALDDEVDDVEVEGGAAGSEDLAVRHSFGAHVTDQVARVIGRVVLVRHNINEHDVRACAEGHCLLQGRRQLSRGV